MSVSHKVYGSRDEVLQGVALKTKGRLVKADLIKHRGKTDRNKDCTPGYYNFEGESQRRQDGNYNGAFPQYVPHLKQVQSRMSENFVFTGR